MEMGLFSDMVALSKTVFASETNFSSSQLLDGREFPIPFPIINSIDAGKLFLKVLKIEQLQGVPKNALSECCWSHKQTAPLVSGN